MDGNDTAATLGGKYSTAIVDCHDAEAALDWEGKAMTCGATETPCLRKHIESDDTYYIDLAPKLGTGETVSSVTSVTCSDTGLTAGNAAVLSQATTITTTERDADGNTTTRTYVIAANKGVSFTLTGGTLGNGCSAITVKYVKSTGKADAEDVAISIYGTDV